MSVGRWKPGPILALVYSLFSLCRGAGPQSPYMSRDSRPAWFQPVPGDPCPVSTEQGSPCGPMQLAWSPEPPRYSLSPHPPLASWVFSSNLVSCSLCLPLPIPILGYTVPPAMWQLLIGQAIICNQCSYPIEISLLPWGLLPWTYPILTVWLLINKQVHRNFVSSIFLYSECCSHSTLPGWVVYGRAPCQCDHL